MRLSGREKLPIEAALLATEYLRAKIIEKDLTRKELQHKINNIEHHDYNAIIDIQCFCTYRYNLCLPNIELCDYAVSYFRRRRAKGRYAEIEKAMSTQVVHINMSHILAVDLY